MRAGLGLPDEVSSSAVGLQDIDMSGASIEICRHMPDAAIHTVGEVLEPRGLMLYRVSLPNGKILLAHLSKALADRKAEFAVGERLLLELTPYDFDTARILGLAD